MWMEFQSRMKEGWIEMKFRLVESKVAGKFLQKQSSLISDK